MKPMKKYFLIAFFFSVALTSCEKPRTEIDYSGIYRGTRFNYNYYWDTASGDLSVDFGSNPDALINVEKGRNGYYIVDMSGSIVSYFQDGIAQSQSDASRTDWYTETYYELKGDSLIGKLDHWRAGIGGIGWWVSSSPRDSTNYSRTEYFMKAL